MKDERERKQQQAEPAYRDRNGKLRDEGLHDEMLNDERANKAVMDIVRNQARKAGLTPQQMEQLY